MKATGVIRRIDELGRIVIPKEIRKTLRIIDGDNMEIYLNEDDIILRKFSLIKNIDDFAQQLTDAVCNYTKKNIFITDNNNIIAVSGNMKKEYLNQEISKQLYNSIKRREKIIEKYDKAISIKENTEITTKYVINSIITNGDVVGLVIITGEDIIDSDLEIGNILADFLGKYLEC